MILITKIFEAVNCDTNMHRKTHLMISGYKYIQLFMCRFQIVDTMAAKVIFLIWSEVLAHQ